MATWGSAAFANFTTSATSHNAGTVTVPSGDNKRLVAVYDLHRPGSSAATTPSMTHNGVSMTQRALQAVTGTPYTVVALFDLICGSTTPSGDLVGSSSASSRAVIGSFTVAGVQQSGSVVSSNSTTLGSTTVTLGAAGVFISALANNASAAGQNGSITGSVQTQVTNSPRRADAGATGEMNVGLAAWNGSGSGGNTWTVNASLRLAHVIIAYTDAATTYAFVGSGGMTAGGAAGVATVKAFAATGGMQTGGAAAIAVGKAFTPTGGLSMSGQAATEGPVVAAASTSYVRRAKRNNLPKVEIP